MLPQWFFGSVGALFDSKNVGLFAYLLVLVAALITPAIWSSKGKTISTRLITVGLFGVLSIPSLMALDRGNSIALAVPALLAFLVSLRRDRYSITVIAIVIATLIKPQFVLLAFALLALRKWRHFFVTIAGVVVANFLAYLMWPRDFPVTIWQTLVATLRYGGVPLTDQYPPNVSLAKGFYTIEIWLRGMFGFSTQHSWADAHAGLLSIVLLLLVLGPLLAMGKRVPAHLSGILLVVCASLFVGTSWSYYLVFALCIAAVCLRDPLDARPSPHAWRGVLDREQGSFARKFASLAIVLATASTLMNVILPIAAQVPGLPPTDLSRTTLLHTTIDIVPVLWLVALAAILVAWALPERKPNPEQLQPSVAATPPRPSWRATTPEQRLP